MSVGITWGDERLPFYFWRHVFVADGGCWLWDSVKTNGYGQWGRNYKNLYAHRVAYETLVGPIPVGLQVDHLCRVRNCVNPKHLEPVPSIENCRRGSWSNKTHCPRGHEYNEINTRVYRWRGKTMRMCRVCNRERMRKRYG